MIAPPRGLVNFAAGLLSARTARRLRRVDPGHAAQRSALADLTARMAMTSAGRAAGVEAGMPYETFRARVAPRGYGAFVPYIERMKRGEPDVLWPGRCALFAVSSGTTSGRAKCLPVTEALLAHFRKAAVESRV
jgi:hypothetical protein